jgi:hypothetical protein
VDLKLDNTTCWKHFRATFPKDRQHDLLPQSCWRLLVAIYKCLHDGKTPTYRRLYKMLGLSCTNAIEWPMRELIRRGLVTKASHLASTIRPTHALIVVRQPVDQGEACN